MKIHYFDCKFCAYDEDFDGEEERRHYGCSHPNGDGVCELNNKYCDEEAECELLDDMGSVGRSSEAVAHDGS